MCTRNNAFGTALITISYFFYTIPGCSKGYKELFHSGDQEPWVFRGGVQGEIQVCITEQPPADIQPSSTYILLLTCILFWQPYLYDCLNREVVNIY